MRQDWGSWWLFVTPCRCFLWGHTKIVLTWLLHLTSKQDLTMNGWMLQSMKYKAISKVIKMHFFILGHESIYFFPLKTQQKMSFGLEYTVCSIWFWPCKMFSNYRHIGFYIESGYNIAWFFFSKILFFSRNNV